MEKELQKIFPENFSVDIESEDLEKLKEFEKVMMMYSCAIREVRTKFEVLNDEFSVANNRNPIEMIKSRVKKPMSIINKLKRKNLEISIDSIREYINDVAGIRVICSFIDDIYEVARMLANQDDIAVLEIKDYIQNPKPNGYRSYHMIIEIPVFFANKKQNVKVEVQLRTIAMDFWASLEHSMKYKKNIAHQEEVSLELKKCADLIAETDLKMQAINESINGNEDIKFE